MKKIPGNITLTTLTIIISMLLTAGIAFILSTIDIRYASNDALDLALLQTHSRTCLEEGVYKLRFDTAYVGAFTISLDTKQCTVTISDVPNETELKSLVVNGSYKNKNIQLEYTVDTAVEPFILRIV